MADETTQADLTVEDAASQLDGLLGEDTDEETSESEEQVTETEETTDQASEETEEVPETEETEEPETAGQEAKTYKLKVDGEELEVTEDELLRGYSRTADYTRKTQKLAEDRRQIEGEAERYRETRTQYEQRLAQMASVLDAQNGPSDEELDKLRTEDPAKYAAAVADQARRERARDKVEQEQRRIASEKEQERLEKIASIKAQEESLLLAAVPTWKDPEVRRSEANKLMEYGVSQGYSEQELGNFIFHRDVVTLRKAMLWDQAQVKAKSVKTKATEAPVLKPGAKQPTKPKRGKVDVARERFARSGKVDDAAAVLDAMDAMFDEEQAARRSA